MSKHTPGPWSIHSNFLTVVVPANDSKKKLGGSIDPDIEAQEYAKIIHGERGTLFPEFHRSRVMPDEAKANAHLIAAAPDLLEALEYLTKQINLGGLKIKKDFSLINAHANACKAIAKAEGRTE